MLSKAASAVNVGDPAIPICFTEDKSKDSLPLYPYLSCCITAVNPDVDPVSVSPAIKFPLTSSNTTSPCDNVGAET